MRDGQVFKDHRGQTPASRGLPPAISEV
jgi:hypothetical protein